LLRALEPRLVIPADQSINMLRAAGIQVYELDGVFLDPRGNRLIHPSTNGALRPRGIRRFVREALPSLLAEIRAAEHPSGSPRAAEIGSRRSPNLKTD